jgi:type I restriction enzyme R subunit
MSNARHTESAFESVIEAHLLAHGYDLVDRERAIFPEVVLDFIRDTQPLKTAT